MGSSAASFLLSEVDEIILYDIVQGLPAGEALDLQNAAEILGLNTVIKGSNDISLMRGLDVIVITAGFGRKAGMSRMDLLSMNLPIIEEIAEEHSASKDSGTIFIVVTNPVDIMTYVFWRKSGIDRRMVAGLSGVLDSGRLKTVLRLGKNIKAMGLSSFVLGEHGDNMVILVDRIKEEYRLSDLELDRVRDETIKAATDIISMKGATVHGPAAAICKMVKAVLSDEGEFLPASVVLNGEYGIKDVCLGVPAKATRDGFYIVEEKLSASEMAMLRSSAEHVRAELKRIGYAS